MPIGKQADVVNETLRSQFAHAISIDRCFVYRQMAGCSALYSDKVLRFCSSRVDLETYLQWPHSRNVPSISIHWQCFSIVTSVKETFGALSLSFSPTLGGNDYLDSLFAAALGKGWLQPACSCCCPSYWPSQKHQSRTAGSGGVHVSWGTNGWRWVTVQ